MSSESLTHPTEQDKAIIKEVAELLVTAVIDAIVKHPEVRQAILWAATRKADA